MNIKDIGESFCCAIDWLTIVGVALLVAFALIAWADPKIIYELFWR